MSEVEQLYAAMQAKFQGNIPWSQLHPQQQNEFIFAVNLILQICSHRIGE
jgi:hypothetical protein